MSSDVLLVTGASGIVGAEVVRHLLRSPDPPLLTLLLRGDDAQIAAKRQWLQRYADVSDEAFSRVNVVSGDISRPALGLDPRVHDRLRSEITGVLHSAANTSFQQRAGDADTHNVEGTRHALEFAKGCARLDRFGLISTAFATGCRTGVIREEPFDTSFGFTTEYERSKADAETLALASGLPLSMYRLAVVVGRRTDGVVARMNGFYPVWRIMHQGLLAMVPGDPEQRIDLVPVDVAAEMLSWLFRQRFEARKIYNVCAGPDRSLTLRELIEEMKAALEREDPVWAGQCYPMPVHVAPKTFRDFIETVDLTANARLRSVVRQQRMFTLQLEYPKTFETAAFDHALTEAGVAFPHAREWFGNLARHALDVAWQPPSWETYDE